jgi:PST family polysaccharide transporter
VIKTISLFLKNIGFNMIADLSNKLVNSVLILMLSYFLGVIAMGSYSVAHTFFSFGLMFSYWGFGNLLTREVARDRTSYNKYLSNFSVIRIIFAIIVIIAINIIVSNLNYIEQTKEAVRIISFGILANTIINLIFALFIALEEIRFLSAISLTISIVRLITFYLVLKFGGSVIAIAIFFTITEFISLIISLIVAKYLLKHFHFEVDVRFCLQQIIKAFPFFWIAVLVILDSRVEILIISIYFNETAVGYYTAMNTIIGGLALFSEGIRNAVFPLFARYQIYDPKQLQKMVLFLVKYIMLVTLPIAISFYFLSDEIILLLFGPGYQTSAELFRMTVWTFTGYSLTVVAIRLLMVYDKERQVVISLFVSGFLTILLNILITPKVDILGVAIVRLVTSYVLLILCILFLSNQGYKFIEFSVILRIIIANIITFLSIFVFLSINVYIGIVLSYTLYFGIIWLLKIINVKEIKLWKSIFHNIFVNSSKLSIGN